MIPKYIYLTYKNDNVPNKVFKRWEELNKDYQIKFYNDEKCYRFIKIYFGQEYADYFSQIDIGPYKADFWRLCILYIYGGIYSDIDIVPHVSIHKIIEDSDMCTCLAMNKKSIFQAFIACTPKNELIKLCIDSFYEKKNDKDFLKDLKNCAPTYDMFHVFCKYLNKIKIKPNKCYYIRNQKIKILQETGDDYLNAYVAYKGKKLFSSRDIDYVNMNLYGISWSNLNQEIPSGNYIETCKNVKIEEDKMYLECLSKQNEYIPNVISIDKKLYYENINGFLFSVNNISIINKSIPKDIYVSSPSNIIKSSDFNYYIFTCEDKIRFMQQNFSNLYQIYIKQKKEIQNYIWGLCIIYKNGGIYLSNALQSKDIIKYINKSQFISSTDINGNISFNNFSGIKNSDLIKNVLDFFINFLNQNNILIQKKILKVGDNKYPVKILNVPGIVECCNIPYNYQEKYCRDTFCVNIEKDKELLYIFKNNDTTGWKQNLELECYINNIPDVLNKGLGNYLLEKKLPVLDNNNNNNNNNKYYENYNKNIIDIVNINYSESL